MRILEKQSSFRAGAIEKQQSFNQRIMEKQQSFNAGATMEKQQSFNQRIMEKQQSFKAGATMEKQQSFKQTMMEKQLSIKLGSMEKQKSFRIASMEKQKSFRIGSMEKQQSRIAKRGDTSLHLASRSGDLMKVQEILECSEDEHARVLLVSNQNNDGETALYVAAENGHIEVVCEILKHSGGPSAALKANNSLDAFHVAARQGHLEILKELLQSFPELAMTTNSLNSTALDTAATLGHIDIVNLLLESSIPNLSKIARSNGKTVLHSAARMGHVEVVRSILSQDPSIGFRTDRKGQTAFHMAVKGTNVEIIRELLKPDPSIINLEDNKGNTALHIATRKGRLQVLQNLLLVEGIDVNGFNKVGETAVDIAVKLNNEEIAAILKDAGCLPAKEHANPPSPAKQLKKTVSDIKHDVHSQLQQSRQTGVRVNKIKKKLKKLHIGGLNNAISSNTVVAVLIATIAFAAIFTLPAQYVTDETDGYSLGQAYIATNAPFIIFFVFDSLALFISLSVVVVQTSLIVTEEKAKTLMVFVINKLMWLACVFISVAFISLTFIVVGRQDRWLAWSTTAIGASIMLTTIGSMCYCIIMHRMGQKSKSMIRRASRSQSLSWSVPVESDPEILNSECRMYAL